MRWVFPEKKQGCCIFVPLKSLTSLFNLHVKNRKQLVFLLFLKRLIQRLHSHTLWTLQACIHQFQVLDYTLHGVVFESNYASKHNVLQLNIQHNVRLPWLCSRKTVYWLSWLRWMQQSPAENQSPERWLWPQVGRKIWGHPSMMLYLNIRLL